jgi:precorrin-2/cobalt-factor-2 C20-methyltransferase
MAGVLYGIGVGPGDPEMMTLKAVKIIKNSDVIGIPAKDVDSCTAYKIARGAAPEIVDKAIFAAPIPMTTDRNELKKAYDDCCEGLKKMLDEGKNIAFLTLGDPTVYSTYMTIHGKMKKMGYTAELISGVPSFCAVAAKLDTALGSRRENIHILSGFYNADEIEKYDGTRILMKSAGKIDEVKKKLLSMDDINAYAVTNCGMDDEKICRDISELSDKAGYFTTIIVKNK